MLNVTMEKSAAIAHLYNSLVEKALSLYLRATFSIGYKLKQALNTSIYDIFDFVLYF